jgi:pimeloyl-ACP methyl ester carboxylesterase
MLGIFGIGIVGGYLATCVLLYVGQERFFFHPRALPQDFDYAFRAPFEEVFLPVEGATLAAVHFTQPGAKGVVLFLHGNGETLQSAEFSAQPFLRNGYDVFAVDYRGYGKSTGTIASEAELHQDMQAAYDYLRQSYRDDQMVFYGRSIGTGLAIKLATTAMPRMLVLETPYFSMQDLVARSAPFVPALLLKYPLRSDQWIGAVRCPVYLFHGTNDTLIPYDSSVRLQEHITAQHELITVASAGHADIPAFALYQETIDRIMRD